mmetsp:Transcript_53477/g.168353  ORF Transcript_53477/g.168353 Transcript_53477/m.168353 type:complete len:271 (-) Transcript_53477:102-914(-)
MAECILALVRPPPLPRGQLLAMRAAMPVLPVARAIASVADDSAPRESCTAVQIGGVSDLVPRGDLRRVADGEDRAAPEDRIMWAVGRRGRRGGEREEASVRGSARLVWACGRRLPRQAGLQRGRSARGQGRRERYRSSAGQCRLRGVLRGPLLPRPEYRWMRPGLAMRTGRCGGQRDRGDEGLLPHGLSGRLRDAGGAESVCEHCPGTRPVPECGLCGEACFLGCVDCLQVAMSPDIHTEVALALWELMNHCPWHGSSELGSDSEGSEPP